MSTPVPDDVADLIERHIDSVEKLEVLLFLRGDRERAWTPDQVSRELHRNTDSIARSMAQLHKGGLLDREQPDEYRFQPGAAELDRKVGRLAEVYAARRVSVVKLIASKPMDSVTTFADAFRLRRDR